MPLCGKMKGVSIEQRLQWLEERHEALSQTVEILMSMQRENEKRFAEITRNFELVLDSIKRLGNIAGADEQRLDDLENT